MSSYRIRPHHGLCLTFFEGKGYSEEFVQNMARIKERSGTNQIIEIVQTADQVCGSCPNSDGRCKSQSKVGALDEKVISLCGLVEGQRMEFARFLALVEERILKTGKLGEVCSQCEWYSLCSTSMATK